MWSQLLLPNLCAFLYFNVSLPGLPLRIPPLFSMSLFLQKIKWRQNIFSAFSPHFQMRTARQNWIKLKCKWVFFGGLLLSCEDIVSINCFKTGLSPNGPQCFKYLRFALCLNLQLAHTMFQCGHKSLGSVGLYSSKMHLFNQKHSKSSNMVKHYYKWNS